jgi:sugar phosphate isomerase/epimerase
MEPFEYAVANGFDAFEWFPDKKESGRGWTVSDISKETRAMVKNIALDHDIYLSVHSHWHLNPLRSDDRELLLKDIDFARDVGASLFNIHLHSDESIAAYAVAIIALMRRLTPLQIRLSIENTLPTGPEHFNELFRRLRGLVSPDKPNLGMCLDLGHANLYDATRNDYLRFIDLLDPHVPIIHIHLHENYGDQDSHLPLFSGPSGKNPNGIKGFIERMHQRYFSGCIILEQWPHPPSLLIEARNRLRHMIGSSVNQRSNLI